MRGKKGLNFLQRIIMVLLMVVCIQGTLDVKADVYTSGSDALQTKAAVTEKIAGPSIKLSSKKVTLYTSGENSSVVLKAEVTGASSKVTWKSSNKRVATVNSSGKVTAKKAGTAVITARANGVSARCRVTVRNTPDKKSIFKAYRKLILKNVDEYGTISSCCYDIDSDGIEELILRHPHITEGSDFDYLIYIYNNGHPKVIARGPYQQWFYVTNDGKYLSIGCADSFSLYSISRGKLTFVHEYYYPVSADEDSPVFQEWIEALDLYYSEDNATQIQHTYPTAGEAVDALRQQLLQ